MPKSRFPSFKNLLKSNPYSPAFKLAEVANKLLIQADIADKEEGDRKYQIFLTLILLERSLDKLRTVVPPGSAVEYPKEKVKLDKQLNKIREGIWNIVEDLDATQIKENLRQLGEDIKLRFIGK